jgi:hypothetical protein
MIIFAPPIILMRRKRASIAGTIRSEEGNPKKITAGGSARD